MLSLAARVAVYIGCCIGLAALFVGGSWVWWQTELLRVQWSASLADSRQPSPVFASSAVRVHRYPRNAFVVLLRYQARQKRGERREEKRREQREEFQETLFVYFFSCII